MIEYETLEEGDIWVVHDPVLLDFFGIPKTPEVEVDHQIDILARWHHAVSKLDPAWSIICRRFRVCGLFEEAPLIAETLDEIAKEIGMSVSRVEGLLTDAKAHWQECQRQSAIAEAQATELAALVDEDSPEDPLPEVSEEERVAEPVRSLSAKKEKEEPLPSLGFYRDFTEAQITQLLEETGFSEITDAKQRRRVASRILELQHPLSQSHLREQARAVIQTEIEIESLTSLGQRYQKALAKELDNENLNPEEVEKVDKMLKGNNDARAKLVEKHAKLLEKIGADDVAVSLQKKQALDQLSLWQRKLCEYRSHADNTLLDGVFTAKEIQWLLTPTELRPAQYPADVVMRLRECLRPEALYNEKYEPTPVNRQTTRDLLKLVRGLKEIQETRKVAAIDDAESLQAAAEEALEEDGGLKEETLAAIADTHGPPDTPLGDGVTMMRAPEGDGVFGAR